jgi:hypothetical protein
MRGALIDQGMHAATHLECDISEPAEQSREGQSIALESSETQLIRRERHPLNAESAREHESHFQFA